MGSLEPASAPATPLGEALGAQQQNLVQCEGLLPSRILRRLPIPLPGQQSQAGAGLSGESLAGMGLGVAIGLTLAPTPAPSSVLGLDSSRGC